MLLTDVIYGQTGVHSMDALSHRLGITIPDEARHATIRGPIATADVFLKRVPMLKARGIEAFGQVLTVVHRLMDLNGWGPSSRSPSRRAGTAGQSAAPPAVTRPGAVSTVT